MAETNPPTPSSPHGPETPRSASPAGVTALLLDWGTGNEGALHALISIVYGELHRQAARALRRERRDHTLQATALVNEVYVKLLGPIGCSGTTARSSSASWP